MFYLEYVEIKEIIPDLDDNGNPMCNINQYVKFIESEIPDFKSQDITCYNPRFYNKTDRPFDLWSFGNSPKWWIVINKLNHDKDFLWDGKKAYQ